MPGTIVFGFHEGSRSETLADYLFSAWGPVTPVRRQDDFGLDLYCALFDNASPVRKVLDYYTVQVKSGPASWIFKSRDEVQWLVEYPTPIFLGAVDKTTGTVTVFHVMPRFAIWTSTKVQDRVKLTPGDGEEGEWLDWNGGESEYSLSAPILRITLSDLINDERMEQYRTVLSAWIDMDRANCDLMRQGLLRYRMPPKYRTNEIPDTTIETGSLPSDFRSIAKGLWRFVDALDCFGHQLGHQDDLMSALLSALLVDHVTRKYGKPDHRIRTNFGSFVLERLDAAGLDAGVTYSGYGSLDALEAQLRAIPVVRQLLKAGK